MKDNGIFLFLLLGIGAFLLFNRGVFGGGSVPTSSYESSGGGLGGGFGGAGGGAGGVVQGGVETSVAPSGEAESNIGSEGFVKPGIYRVGERWVYSFGENVKPNEALLFNLPNSSTSYLVKPEQTKEIEKGYIQYPNFYVDLIKQQSVRGIKETTIKAPEKKESVASVFSTGGSPTANFLINLINLVNKQKQSSFLKQSVPSKTVSKEIANLVNVNPFVPNLVKSVVNTMVVK